MNSGGQPFSGLLTLLGGLGGTVVLLMPGYVLGAVYSRGIRGPAVSDRAFVAVSALGGLVTHLIGLVGTLPLIRAIARDGLDAHVVSAAFWALLVLLVLPAGIGGTLGIFAEGRLPFSKRECPEWLTDLLNSFASSDPDLRDIYIEELWTADQDGWFDQPYPTNQGIWISGDQIARVEFYEGQE